MLWIELCIQPEPLLCYSIKIWYCWMTWRLNISLKASNILKQKLNENNCFTMCYFIMTLAAPLLSNWAIYAKRTLVKSIHLLCVVPSYHHLHTFFRTEQYTRKELCWKVFICYVLFHHSITLTTFFHSEQYSRTELSWELFICHVLFHNIITLTHSFELRNILEQNFGDNYLFTMCCS
jgi:hypothetical protein